MNLYGFHCNWSVSAHVGSPLLPHWWPTQFTQTHRVSLTNSTNVCFCLKRKLELNLLKSDLHYALITLVLANQIVSSRILALLYQLCSGVSEEWVFRIGAQQLPPQQAYLYNISQELLPLCPRMSMQTCVSIDLIYYEYLGNKSYPKCVIYIVSSICIKSTETKWKLTADALYIMMEIDE